MTKEIGDNSRIRKTDNHVETMVDDEIVLMHIDNGKFFSLSNTGRKAWELLEEHSSLGALVAAIRAEYDVPEETCRSELVAMLAKLEERTLIAIEG